MFRKGIRYTTTFFWGAFAGVPIYVTVSDKFFTIARVEGCSMQPTLNPEQQQQQQQQQQPEKETNNHKKTKTTTTDYVLLNRWLLRNNDVKIGDIVAVTSPKNHNTNLIKRVIGVEGDVIRTPRYKYDHVRIPRGHCWVEGDNARESMDSNSFGSVSANLVNAVATHVVWPPSRWQRLEFSVPVEREPVFYKSHRGKKKKKSVRKPRTKLDDGMLVEIDCVNITDDGEVEDTL